MLLDVARSHRSWFGRVRERREIDGVSTFLGRDDAVLAFPEPWRDATGAVRAARDAGVAEVSCWALAPDEQLGEHLLALGFQDGWQPHWMHIDPRNGTDMPRCEIEETSACSAHLPYASPAHESALSGYARHFVARDAGTIVGHAVVDIDGDAAGIYDMGVAPESRRHGFGRALTLAALACARVEGCTSVTLNATGEGELLYRSVGFESLGLGMTWWMFPKRL